MRWLTSRVKRFWRWALGLPRMVSIPATVILVAGIAFGAFRFVLFWDYMQDDPEFCQSCHIMGDSWDRWETSVQDEYCKDCHESGDPRWRQVAATSGHKQHEEAENIACTKCHSVTVHRFHPPGEICGLCHADHDMEVAGMSDMHCPVCHDFLVEGDLPLPTRSACLDCHEALASGIIWSADAPMQYPCGDCHLPHQQRAPMVDCESCHTVEGYHLRGAHSAARCETCHEAHEWQTAGRDSCLTCHPAQTEHQAGVPCSTCHAFPAQ